MSSAPSRPLLGCVEERQFEVGLVLVRGMPLDHRPARAQRLERGRVERVEVTDDERRAQAERERGPAAPIGAVQAIARPQPGGDVGGRGGRAVGKDDRSHG